VISTADLRPTISPVGIPTLSPTAASKATESGSSGPGMTLILTIAFVGAFLGLLIFLCFYYNACTRSKQISPEAPNLQSSSLDNFPDLIELHRDQRSELYLNSGKNNAVIPTAAGVAGGAAITIHRTGSVDDKGHAAVHVPILNISGDSMDQLDNEVIVYNTTAPKISHFQRVSSEHSLQQPSPKQSTTADDDAHRSKGHWGKKK